MIKRQLTDEEISIVLGLIDSEHFSYYMPDIDTAAERLTSDDESFWFEFDRSVL